MDFIHRTAEGQNLSAQDKRGALAISPSIVYDLSSTKVLLVVDECV